jgi:autotransporter-associated beta strand protein
LLTPTTPFWARGIRGLRTRFAVVLAIGVGVGVGAAKARAAAPAGYQLVFADEFNGSSLDTMKWNYNYPWGDGHTHNHIAWMDASQVLVGSGKLNLQAIAQKSPDAPADHPYTSGAINTSGKLNLTYGYIEASMKMSDIEGTWPAFWTLQSGWPPEIDVMEFPRGADNAANQYWANWHYTNTSGAAASEGWQRTASGLTTGFNTFAVEWTATTMKFYLNGTLMNSVQNTSSIGQAANMYLLLDQAVGGWPGNPPSNDPFPSNFEVDWVRVWQQPPSGSSSTSTWNINGGGSWDNAAAWTGGATPKYGNQIANFASPGNAATATISWTGSRALGGISFAGNGTNTTAYNVGTFNCGLQLVNSSGTANITAAASSTVDQTVNARLELYNNAQLRNDMSGHSLVINGAVIGTGSLTIEGVGTVVLANASSNWTGGTTIDGGTQGPAVLRTAVSNALGSGPVLIGAGGNATTARLEIAGSGITLPNAIALNGRNSASIGIENISGTNMLSGTITLGSGGGTYPIRCDAGTLMLTGSAGGGVAVTSAATGARTLTLDGSGDGIINGAVSNGAATLSVAKSGSGTWTLSGNNTYSGATTVAAGTLSVQSNLTASASIAVTGGTLSLPSNGTHSRVIKTSSASVSGGGKIDIDDNKLILTSQPLGTWNGAAYTGVSGAVAAGAIITTQSSATGGNTLTAVGVASNADLGYATFAGLSVAPSAVLVMYTYAGDANLDGSITGDDYFQIDSGFPVGATGWFNGDFNFDGIVNGDDYFVIDSNFGAQGAAFPTTGGLPSAVTAVPEPTSLPAICLAAALGGASRRRRSSR